MTKKHYTHHMEEATGEPVGSYKVVCERCQKALGDVPDGSLRGLKFVMCRDCFGLGEPTIIEIKGEPYPEELGPDEFNRLTNRVADAALTLKRAYLDKPRYHHIDELVELDRAFRRALAEYEKMVSGE